MPASLFFRILAQSNMSAAWLRVRDNRGAAGIDGIDVEEFGGNWVEQVAALRQAVIRGEYRPARLRRILLDRPGKKPRYLAIPTVRDRVLQTAAALVLTPIFEAGFEDSSYGYRRGC